jgi:hypothetical protein
MGGRHASACSIASLAKSMFVASMRLRMIVVSLVVAIAGCSEGSDAGVLGGVDRPDLDYTLIVVSNQVETGVKPQLLYERCEKQTPIVEPVSQKWFCRFGFQTIEGAKDCSAVVSVHPDDHIGIWKPDLGDLDPVSGKEKPNLVCRRRPTAR